MKTYAMYIGKKDTKVPKCRVYIVGFYQTLNSYVIKCMKTEFVYSSMKSVLNDWKFFAEVSDPVLFE